MSATADYSSLDPCVHCGFCLPACPTYLATGDEADSPRGRIVLMRALERGELGPDDEALAQHLDACLGCLGCEPACPSGVGYGKGIQTAREQLFAARRLSPMGSVVLGVFRHEWLWRPLFTLSRVFRATGIPKLLSGRGRLGFAMGMLAATVTGSRARSSSRARLSSRAQGGNLPGNGSTPARTRSLAALGMTTASGMPDPPAPPSPSPTVALFRGCVMDTLFRHVHDATRRTLEANGYTVVEADGQACCGALHEHAGDRAAAEALARVNVAALADSAEYVVVNSAGCGALLKGYGRLLETEAAVALAGKVRDVSELLAERGPRPGGSLPLDVAYDAPCHLQHAQRVHAAPLTVLGAIPSLRLRVLTSSDKCCGSAGIYSLVRPAMARAVLDLKIESFAAADPMPGVVATGNPGCLMQIGGGVRAAGLPIRLAHPVELLDESYRVGGVYESP
ncbi:MAG: (Fe-S)-binding protein [Gemmatimonadales bacterium]|nr:(Fe-S)-binding protein [Gemmatimonadales bacterium]